MPDAYPPLRRLLQRGGSWLRGGTGACPGPSAEHDVGGGAAVGPGAVAELSESRLEVRSLLDAFHEQLLDILDGRFGQPVGLGVVGAAGLVEDAIVLAVRLEGLAAELRSPVRADGLGEAEVLKPLLDGPGNREGGSRGQTVHPWVAGVAVDHHQVVAAACCEHVHAHRLHGLRCGSGRVKWGGGRLPGEGLRAHFATGDSVMDGSVHPRPVVQLMGGFLRLDLAGVGNVEEVEDAGAG